MSTDSVNVLIEISKNSHIKYEYDHRQGRLVCDRVLHAPFKYPFNYGFVPYTLSEDGDPLDVVVLMDDELIPGSSISCRIIGCLETSDEKGNDPKLIVVPSDKVDPSYKEIIDVSDLSKHTMKKVIYFFSHYKELENKKVNIGKVLNHEEAYKVYKESCINTDDD